MVIDAALLNMAKAVHDLCAILIIQAYYTFSPTDSSNVDIYQYI